MGFQGRAALLQRSFCATVVCVFALFSTAPRHWLCLRVPTVFGTTLSPCNVVYWLRQEMSVGRVWPASIVPCSVALQHWLRALLPQDPAAL